MLKKNGVKIGRVGREVGGWVCLCVCGNNHYPEVNINWRKPEPMVQVPVGKSGNGCHSF